MKVFAIYRNRLTRSGNKKENGLFVNSKFSIDLQNSTRMIYGDLGIDIPGRTVMINHWILSVIDLVCFGICEKAKNPWILLIKRNCLTNTSVYQCHQANSFMVANRIWPTLYYRCKTKMRYEEIAKHYRWFGELCQGPKQWIININQLLKLKNWPHRNNLNESQWQIKIDI